MTKPGALTPKLIHRSSRSLHTLSQSLTPPKPYPPYLDTPARQSQPTSHPLPHHKPPIPFPPHPSNPATLPTPLNHSHYHQASAGYSPTPTPHKKLAPIPPLSPLPYPPTLNPLPLPNIHPQSSSLSPPKKTKKKRGGKPYLLQPPLQPQQLTLLNNQRVIIQVLDDVVVGFLVDFQDYGFD